MRKLYIRIFLVVLMLVNFSEVAVSQFLQDNPSMDKVQKGMDYLYNMQYTLAEGEFASIKSKYSDHPVTFLLNALVIEWKNIPIDENAGALKLYQNELNKCITASHKYYDKPGYRMETVFFLLASHGFLALTENYKGSFVGATQEARKALKYFKEAKQYKDKNAEFLFPNGLYDYYRVMYPETKPIVKPLMVFFEAGNKAAGLSQLERSFRTSIFSRNEAATYLRDIYIKYESDFGRALRLSTATHNKYPSNYVFTVSYIESLLLNLKFDEAEQLNKRISSNSNPVAKLSYNMFAGYIAQHKYKNLSDAESYYKKALAVKYNDRFTKEYVAYSYLGLARIAGERGDKNAAINYYKQCLKYAEYLWLVKLAKDEQKSV